MNRRMIWRTLVRNKAVSLITILFISVAAMMLSLAASLSASLFGALDRLMLDAKTPHYLQMHSGDLGLSGLTDFAEGHDNVEDFQVLNFLNVDNAGILLGENALTDSLQGNGFSTQSERFDLLLGLNNQPVYPKNGELYVPVCYFKDGAVNVGDQAFICGRPFVVAGFIRDSQMNSTLASSKRFVISEADYDWLAPFAQMEYLIEFRFKRFGRFRRV